MELNSPGMSRLLAKDAITDVLYRYCRGIDRFDLELVRSCYHADATDDHGSFQGGIDDYLAWVEPIVARYDRTFHFVGNIIVDFEQPQRGARTQPVEPGSVAWAETYGVAHHENAGGPTHANLATAFRFIDRFEHRDGTWAIAARTATTEWSRKDDESNWWIPPDGFERGSRDDSDPIYRSAD